MKAQMNILVDAIISSSLFPRSATSAAYAYRVVKWLGLTKGLAGIGRDTHRRTLAAVARATEAVEAPGRCGRPAAASPGEAQQAKKFSTPHNFPRLRRAQAK